jgi:hypothetical protein
MNNYDINNIRVTYTTDVFASGVIRSTYAGPAYSLGQSIPCPAADAGAAVDFTGPSALIDGLYAVVTESGNSNTDGPYHAGGLMYWNGGNFFGGFNNNPSNSAGFGVRPLSSRTYNTFLTFCNGASYGLLAGDVNIVFRLIIAGSDTAQLWPFT